MKKRWMLAALCAVVLCSLLTVPAAASVSDDLNNYAKVLAAENGAQVGWRRDLVKKSSDDRWDRYRLNTTSPSNGRKLFVLEVKTNREYERVSGPGSNCHMDVALFYLDSSGHVCWTDDFNFDDYAESFLGREAALRGGQFDAVTVELPGDYVRMLGVYFHKEGGPIQGKYEWSAHWLRVGMVDGSLINRYNRDSDGYEFIGYNGSCEGYLTNLNELDYKGWGQHLWRFSTPAGDRSNTASHAQYMLELVTGSTSYYKGDANVAIDFTDGTGRRQTRTINLSNAYERLFPGDEVNTSKIGGQYQLNTSAWLDTNASNMMAMGRAYTGNYVEWQHTDHALTPYTSTTLNFVLPLKINTIHSIKVALVANSGLPGNMEFQSVRLIRVNTWSNNYFNGSFSMERQRSFVGELLCETTPGKVSNVTNGNSTTYTANAVDQSKRLVNYAEGSRPVIDNTGAAVAVSVQIADVLGAGVETLAAANKSHNSYYRKGSHDFPGDDHLTSLSGGSQGFFAYWNLQPFRREFMTLEVDYKDVRGALRKVEIPFYTTYMNYLLKSLQGNFSGTAKNADYKTWCAGVLQQNENIGLPFRLAEYQELVGVKLTYGKAPSSFTYSAVSDYGSLSVNASSDPFTVENICFYEGVTASNFKTTYDDRLLGTKLTTSLTPKWHYASRTTAGTTLSSGGSITAQVGSGLTAGAPQKRTYENKYVVRIKTADIETAGTSNPVSISLSYTTKSGDRRKTTTTEIAGLAEAFYGKSYRDAQSTYQYARHMRRNCVVEFIVELTDVATVDSVTLSLNGTNEWQLEYVKVTSLDTIERRYGERALADNGTDTHTYWRRDYTGTQVAYAKQMVLLYQNSPSKTIYFTTYDEDGNATPPDKEQPAGERYLNSIPDSMTYEDTRKDLGLAISKYTYQVDVQVADVQDAGSGNYFYFQLVFANGTSGVVLANQQLASDSFRQGVIESFQIRTTQNYGDVIAVRIICDNTSSTSNVFDKLNIDNISVTLAGNNGLSHTWIVDRVGWIDITYQDEGANDDAVWVEAEVSSTVGNAEIVKEFSITRNATSVDLLFCIATNPNSQASGYQSNCTYSGKLIYQDNEGVQQAKSFDLTDAIKTYNDTEKTAWLYRAGHTDRFCLTLTGVRSVTALELSRTGGSGTWTVDSVSIQQIGSLGDVYLAPSCTEYMRDPKSAEDLALSNSGSVSIPAGGNATISFTENAIETMSDSSNETWTAHITRVPNASEETLNIYLYPGTLLGKKYTFTGEESILVAAQYTTIYGGRSVQNVETFTQTGESEGETVMYGSITVSTMSSLNSLHLGSTVQQYSGSQPVISHAIIERVRGNVVLGIYKADFGNAQLTNAGGASATVKGQEARRRNQVVRLHLAPSQSVPLTAETNDIAVALRYTSSLDLTQSEKVYLSPYYYLTDFGLTSVSTGAPVELPFNVDGVERVVGLSVISSGPILSVERAMVENYTGDAEGNNPASLLNTCYISEPFMISTMSSTLRGGDETVVPVTFTFTVPEEEKVPGGGSSGNISMDVTYQDNQGARRTQALTDLLSYLPVGQRSFASGGTYSITVLMTDVASLTSATLYSPDDALFLTSLYAQVTLPDGTTSSGGTTVNNWSRSGQSLEVDLRPESLREEGAPAGNWIETFSVSGQATEAGAPASASGGGSLLITAYSGDTVILMPSVTTVGSPDTSVVWNTNGLDNHLTVRSDGSAVFSVPASAAAGTMYSSSVSCSGDRTLSIPVTISVVERPPAPEPSTDPEPDRDIPGSTSGEADNDPSGEADNGPSGEPDNGPSGEPDNGPSGEADNDPSGEPANDSSGEPDNDSSGEPAD